MDRKFFELLNRYSIESTQTTPCDQETVALGYMREAYALGKEAAYPEPRPKTTIN